MRITKDEVQRWDWRCQHDFDKDGPLQTEQSVEQLLEIYQIWWNREYEAKQRLRQVAVKLMDNQLVSVSKLSTLLHVSRQTLYAWYDEARPRPVDDGDHAAEAPTQKSVTYLPEPGATADPFNPWKDV